MGKKRWKAKIVLLSIPLLMPFSIVIVLMMTICGGGSEPISPPVEEDKAAQYREVCMKLGVPWDIVLLVDVYNNIGKIGNVEEWDPLDSALEFLELDEKRFTITEEKVQDENGEEQIIGHKTFEGTETYRGKTEILDYIGCTSSSEMKGKELLKLASDVATNKSNSSTSYEVSVRLLDIKSVLENVFQDKKIVQDILELHDSRYIIMLYGGAEGEDIGNVHIGDFSSVETTVWEFLKEVGFSDVGAAAVMGNVRVESSFNTAAIHNDYYFGLCQWGGGRASHLKSYAAEYGTDWTDLETQLNFLNTECASSYSSVYNCMKTADDLIYATDMFCTCYEICPGELGNWAYSVVDGKAYQCLADRRGFAQIYYQQYAAA